MPFYRLCPVDSHTCTSRACLGDGHSWDAQTCTQEKTAAPTKSAAGRCPHGHEYFCSNPPCSKDGSPFDLKSGKPSSIDYWKSQGVV